MKLNLEELFNSLNISKEIRPSDIPNMDLYMEQLTGFIDSNLQGLKRNEDDKILTKTMINSYTKDGLLMPPINKKKYTKYHVISLILIYHLKQILSINDIQALFSPILKDITTEKDDVIPLEDIYSIFLDMKSKEAEDYCDLFDSKQTAINEEISKLNISEVDKETAEIFLTVITLIAKAEANKRLAEKLIDEYFIKK